MSFYNTNGGNSRRSMLARSTRGGRTPSSAALHDIDSEEEERMFLDEISGAVPASDELDIDDLRYQQQQQPSRRRQPIGNPLEDSDDDDDDDDIFERDPEMMESLALRGGSKKSGSHMSSAYHRGGRRERMRHYPVRGGRYMHEEPPSRRGYSRRGMRRRNPREHSYMGRYSRLAGASAVADKAGYDKQVYYGKFEKQPAENLGNDIFDGDVAVAYSGLRIPFRYKTTLAEAASLRNGHQITIPLEFGKNKMARTISESGAFLGDVSIANLRHNAPVSLAMRVECKPAGSVMPGVSLRAPNTILKDVADPVHTVVSKRPPSNSGFDMRIRDVQPVCETWLSDPKYRGEWSAENIHKGINPIGGSSKVSVIASHPIADLLHHRGLLSEQDVLQGEEMAVVEGHLVDDALGELKSQEHGNSFFKSAQDLQLVLHRAYGEDEKQIGKPAMTDPSELLDNVVEPPSDQRLRSKMINRRLNQPFVIEGEWIVGYGKPIELEDDNATSEAEVQGEFRTNDDDGGGHQEGALYDEEIEESEIRSMGAPMHAGSVMSEEEHYEQERLRQQQQHQQQMEEEGMILQEDMSQID